MSRSSWVILGCILVTPVTCLGTLGLLANREPRTEQPRPTEPVRPPEPPVVRAELTERVTSVSDELPPAVRRELAWAQVLAVFWLVLAAAVLIFFMVVAWRAMRAHERLAAAAERAARRGAPPTGAELDDAPPE